MGISVLTTAALRGAYTLCLLVLITACATTSVMQSWINPQAQRPKSVMIFGVTKEESLRRNYEDTLARLLSAEGLRAQTSYQLLQTEGEVSKERVIDAVRKAGVESVFITRLVRLTKEVDAVPVPGPAWGMGFAPMGSYYTPYWPAYYADSYQLVEREFAYIESNLYQTQTNTLVMSILTRTEDPNYGIGQVEELAQLIVKEFRKNGLLPQATSP